MIRYQVRIGGRLVDVQGYILESGAGLAYWHNGQRQIAKVGQWFLHPATVADPSFRMALMRGLVGYADYAEVA